MKTLSSIDYFMDDPREAARLARKVDPEAWVEKYLSRHIPSRGEVLSVGCGPGTILRAISALHPTVRGTGVDISPTRVQQARERNAGNPKVRIVCGDASALQFPWRSFDVVYTRMLLQYVAQKEGVVSEMVRVLKPGGIAVLQDLDGQLMWHYPEDPIMQRSIDQVTQALAQTGFDPFIGRKLFWLAQRAGLENLDVQVECYHLIAGAIDPSILEQWELKLEIAKPTMVQALGSETEASEQIRRFMEYLRRPDTLTYSNVFTITGKKPL